MGIFDKFASKEELIKALESEIEEMDDADGTAYYRLADRGTIRSKYNEEVDNARKQRNLKQEAQAKYDSLLKERERDLVELEELRKFKPDDMKANLQRYIDQSAESASRIRALEEQLAPLKKENEAYKKREQRAVIETALVEAAHKMNCVESAMRDVKRLAPMFHLSENGVPLSEDGKTVSEVVKSEIEQSPHWLKRSQGGGSASGYGVSSKGYSQSKFQEALKSNDFAAILANAPRLEL